MLLEADAAIFYSIYSYSASLSRPWRFHINVLFFNNTFVSSSYFTLIIFLYEECWDILARIFLASSSLPRAVPNSVNPMKLFIFVS